MNRKHALRIVNLGSIRERHEEQPDDFSGCVVTASVVKGVHALVVDAFGAIGVSVEKSLDDRRRWLTSTGTVNRKETPHDLGFIIIVNLFIRVTNNPCACFLRVSLDGAESFVPVATGDGLVEPGDILVIVNLQVGRHDVRSSHGSSCWRLHGLTRR
jgi:hypothetical protein